MPRVLRHGETPTLHQKQILSASAKIAYYAQSAPSASKRGLLSTRQCTPTIDRHISAPKHASLRQKLHCSNADAPYHHICSIHRKMLPRHAMEDATRLLMTNLRFMTSRWNCHVPWSTLGNTHPRSHRATQDRDGTSSDEDSLLTF